MSDYNLIKSPEKSYEFCVRGRIGPQMSQMPRKSLKSPRNQFQVLEKVVETFWIMELGRNSEELSFNSFMTDIPRNQSIDFQSKSMDWFLYDRDLLNERVKVLESWKNNYISWKDFRTKVFRLICASCLSRIP